MICDLALKQENMFQASHRLILRYVDERRNRKADIEQLHLDKLSSVLLG